MTNIVRSCYERRRSTSRRVWRQYAIEKARHPEILLCSSLQDDKPRGYAGDAVMLDHIYGTGEGRLALHPATTDGQIYAYTVNAPAPTAVRFRRATLARLIDESVLARPETRDVPDDQADRPADGINGGIKGPGSWGQGRTRFRSRATASASRPVRRIAGFTRISMS